MKRAICIILAVFCTFSLFARDRHVTSSEEGRRAEDLLDDGLYANQIELASITPVLAPEELSLLYAKNKESSVVDCLENGLLGFGIGSFSAGDKKGGWIQLGLEGGGALLGISSLGYFIAYGFSGTVSAIFGKKDDKAGSIMGASVVGMIAGAGCFLGGRIYGIIRGIKYPKQYNKDLQTTLYGTAGSAPQLSLAPVFSTSGVGFGVGVRF